ncbi:cytochrome P450 [Inquilinus sp.]|jgi:cytochrome P450|uniref:cytochrome P450 n=1 Tax=Inquilinus sp. TaxID=1932117 RepID=UPI0037849547
MQANPVQPIPVRFDLPVLTEAQFGDDPHATFRLYRANYPVVAHHAGTCLVLRQADIEWLSKDPRLLASETGFPRMLGVTEGPLFDAFDYGMLTANGDAHRRRRAPFSRTFAARAMAGLRPVIRRSAERLIEAWRAAGHVEFVEQFASRLPAVVISDLLGLPQRDIPAFTRHVYDVTRFVTLSVQPEEISVAEDAMRHLLGYVEALLDERRRQPRGDFLSAFLAAADDAGELSPLEMLFQIIILIIAGTDTTRVAAVMQVCLLLQHREQWTEVCLDPALIPAAVAEALRYEPSAASFGRVTIEDIDLQGFMIPAGTLCTLSTMSAMRDERVYANPDVFDIHRVVPTRLHPVFGAGAHRCIGEALARIELEESLGALTAAIPQLRLETAPVIRGYTGIRRVDRMDLSWTVCF